MPLTRPSVLERFTAGLGIAALALGALVAPGAAAAQQPAPKSPAVAPGDSPDAELLANLDLLKETDLARDGDMLSRLRMLEWSRASRNMNLLDSQAPLTPAPAGNKGN